MSSAPRTLNVTEQHQLLDKLLAHDAPHKSFRKGVRNYCMACLMLEAGLRVGEVVALKLRHLYFNDLPVRSLVLTPEITKNHKERIVPISSRLNTALEEYYKSHAWLKMRATVFSAWCTMRSIEPITARQVERIINRAGYAAFGRPVNPHMLRHTFATKLMRVTDTFTVMELLGHSNVASTQIYTHPNEDDKKRAIENL